MATSGTNSRQSELGDFLRSRRQKLMPKAVGLPAGRRRRTPGLRREAEADRNSRLSVLTNPATRRLFGASGADEARRIVAQFRATHDLWAGDPAFRDLLTRLREGCPEFAGWWEAHDVSGVAAGRKSLTHHKKGRLKLEYASFQANEDKALKIVIYSTF